MPGRPRVDRRKLECQEVDLECTDCVRCSARSLAHVAEELPVTRLRTLFHAMYPDTQCRPMVNMFVEIVQAAQSGPAEVPMRKGPMMAPAPLAPRVRFAVA